MPENKEKKSQLAEVFRKDYKYEGLVLLVLALISLVLGVMIYKGQTTEGAYGLVVNPGVFLIGDFPLVFAWILIVLGALSLVLSIWPYYKPSVSEIKRVSWLPKSKFLANSATVLSFTLIFVLFYLLVDTSLSSLLQSFSDFISGLRS